MADLTATEQILLPEKLLETKLSESAGHMTAKIVIRTTTATMMIIRFLLLVTKTTIASYL